MWDNLGRTANFNPMATCLLQQFTYANLSFLFTRFHTETIYLGYNCMQVTVRMMRMTSRRKHLIPKALYAYD